MSSSPSRMTAFAVAILALFAIPSTALGQAWVGAKNGLSVSIDYTYSPSDRVVESDGEVLDDPGLGSANHTVALSTEYVPIDKLAISAMVPIVTTHHDRLENPVNPLLAPHGSFDDGDFHTVLQDLRVTTRYMVLEQPVALAPHLGFSIPLSNYETVGFAASGRGLKQLHIGLGVGKYFTDGPLANFYGHLLYEFSLGEKYDVSPETSDYNQMRSDVKVIVGYFINDKIEVNLGGDYRKAHDGLYFLDYPMAPEVVQRHHDPLLAESFLLLGGGATYEPIEGLRFNLALRYWTLGENTRDAHTISFGVSWDVI